MHVRTADVQEITSKMLGTTARTLLKDVKIAAGSDCALRSADSDRFEFAVSEEDPKPLPGGVYIFAPAPTAGILISHLGLCPPMHTSRSRFSMHAVCRLLCKTLKALVGELAQREPYVTLKVLRSATCGVLIRITDHLDHVKTLLSSFSMMSALQILKQRCKRD